jgi:hypothetical protein
MVGLSVPPLEGYASLCVDVLVFDRMLISVLMYYTSTQVECSKMWGLNSKLERHLPLIIALLFFATGDYLSLLRQVQLLV